MRFLTAVIVVAACALSACPGPKGDPGEADPCTVEDNGDGTATMTCPDGTSVIVPVAQVSDAGVSQDAGTEQDAAASHDASADDASLEDAGPAPGPCDGFDPNKVVEGSYTINNTIDLRAFAGTLCITGNLTITAPGMTRVVVRELEKIGGSLSVQGGNDVLESVEFSALASVGGDMKVGDNYYPNPALPNCMATNLRDQVQAAQGIGGTVTIRDNANPCAPSNPCSSGTCREDCSQPPDFYVCQ